MYYKSSRTYCPKPPDNMSGVAGMIVWRCRKDCPELPDKTIRAFLSCLNE